MFEVGDDLFSFITKLLEPDMRHKIVAPLRLGECLLGGQTTGAKVGSQ